MGFKEIFFYRIPQQFQYKILGHFQKYTKVNSNKFSIRSNFELNQYYKHIKRINLFQEKELLSYSFFDTSLNLSGEINWLKDYKNNIISNRKYYAKINRQNFNEIGDIKYVCEPSRFHFLPFLALKAFQSKDSFWLNRIKYIIESWSNQNPYLQSVHWTSGIEVGIRSVNLAYTHMILLTFKNLDPELDKAIKQLILYSYHYLKKHLSLYSSANNHLTAELMGLVVISSMYENNELKREKTKWTKKLFKEINNQINPDGVHMELSTHYHAEVTDHFLNALVFLKKSKEKIPIEIENRFMKMFKFLNHVEYNGLNSNFGDNDEGHLIYPYFDPKFSIYKSLLSSVGKSKNLDWRNYLIFGDNTKPYSDTKINNKILSDTLFLNSGYAFLYDHLNEAKLAFDFGNIGDDISAAHGHSDIFHFTFDIEGVPILLDSGTYQYHSRFDQWRKYFRSIAAHNTVSINKKDHAFQSTRMSWLNVPQTELVNSHISEEKSLIEAKTNAFIKEGVIHKRKLIFDKLKKQIEIVDSLKADNKSSDNLAIFYLNLNSNLKWIHSKDTLKTEIKGSKVSIMNQKFIKGKLENASENEVIGWRSSKYGVKKPGQSFIFEEVFNEQLTLTTKISY